MSILSFWSAFHRFYIKLLLFGDVGICNFIQPSDPQWTPKKTEKITGNNKKKLSLNILNLDKDFIYGILWVQYKLSLFDALVLHMMLITIKLISTCFVFSFKNEKSR